jgi:hypothetical protein
VFADDVLIEYQGQSYRLPMLLVGSARSKLTDPDLAERLEEAFDGRRAAVVLDARGGRAFYAAARGIAVGMDRSHVDWHRLLVELQRESARDNRSRSRILTTHPQ